MRGLRVGWLLVVRRGEKQIPCGDDRKRGKGKSKGKSEKQIPCGDDRKKGKGKSEKQIPCGDDRQKGKGNNKCEGKRKGLRWERSPFFISISSLANGRELFPDFWGGDLVFVLCGLGRFARVWGVDKDFAPAQEPGQGEMLWAWQKAAWFCSALCLKRKKRPRVRATPAAVRPMMRPVRAW